MLCMPRQHCSDKKFPIGEPTSELNKTHSLQISPQKTNQPNTKHKTKTMDLPTIPRRKPSPAHHKTVEKSIGSTNGGSVPRTERMTNHSLNKFTCLGAIFICLLSLVMPSIHAFPSHRTARTDRSERNRESTSASEASISSSSQERTQSGGGESSSSRKDKSLDFANLELFANTDYNNLNDDIDTVYYDQLGSESIKTFANNYPGLADDAALGANDDLSRSRPTTIRGDGNSPIYYIRLPPTPYMFVPGVGYVSQPPNLRLPPSVVPNQQEQSQIVNVPINFMSNGKPTSIYTIEHDKPVWPKPAPQRPWQTQPVGAGSWQNQGWQQQQQQQQQRPSVNEIQRPVQKPTKQKPQQNGDSNLYYLDKGPYKFNGAPTDIFLLRNAYDSLYSDTLQSFYP